MTLYCKAYRLGDLRHFPNWSELSQGRDQEMADDTIVYITERFNVVEDCLSLQEADKGIVFEPCDSWKAYCQEKLAFEAPDWAHDGL